MLFNIHNPSIMPFLNPLLLFQLANQQSIIMFRYDAVLQSLNHYPFPVRNPHHTFRTLYHRHPTTHTWSMSMMPSNRSNVC